jgi:CHASE2 domain-containing sensor protein
VDKVLRIVVGLALIGLTLAGMIPAWGWIGVVPLATALIGWCPAYSLIGVSTKKAA